MLRGCPILPCEDGSMSQRQYVLSKCTGQSHFLCHSEGCWSNIKHPKTNPQVQRCNLATL